MMYGSCKAANLAAAPVSWFQGQGYPLPQPLSEPKLYQSGEQDSEQAKTTGDRDFEAFG